MRATVERKTLLDCLSFVSRFADRPGSDIPIVTHLRIEASGDRLAIIATDLRQSAKSFVQCDIREVGEACLPADRLMTFVKSASGSDLAIHVDGSQATITCGRARVSLPTLPASDFPQMPMLDSDGDFTFPMSGLTLAAVAGVSFAVSAEQTRFYLAGIHWAFENGAIEFCATDGSKLAVLRVKAETTARDGIIVPGFEIPAGDATVTVADGKFIRIACGDKVAASRLIEGTFPDYHRVVPQNPVQMLFDREELASAIGRCAVIRDRKAAASSSILFVGRDGVATLSATSTFGDLTETIPYKGGDFQTCIASEVIAPCLSAFGCETIEIRWGDHQTPVTIHDPKDASKFAVAMPYRDSRVNEFVQKRAA